MRELNLLPQRQIEGGRLTIAHSHKSLSNWRSYHLETTFVARKIAEKSNMNFIDFSWFYIG